MDKAHPGLTDLFITEFMRQMDVKEREQEANARTQNPEVAAWERDEVVSIKKTVVEVKAPTAEQPQEAAAPKHRLTPEEKQIRDAVMDTLKAQIAHNNAGMLSTYRSSEQSFRVMARNGVRIEGNTVTQNGEPLFAIHRRHSAKKTQGCYRELTPTLEYIRQEKKQEKPSIRDQLKAAAKSQPEKKAPAKAKSHDMEYGVLLFADFSGMRVQPVDPLRRKGLIGFYFLMLPACSFSNRALFATSVSRCVGSQRQTSPTIYN